MESAADASTSPPQVQEDANLALPLEEEPRLLFQASIGISRKVPAEPTDENTESFAESSGIGLTDNNAASIEPAGLRSSFTDAAGFKEETDDFSEQSPSRIPVNIGKDGVLEAHSFQQMMTSSQTEVRSSDEDRIRKESAQSPTVEDVAEEFEEEWYLKPIPWPPLPPIPSSSRNATLFSQGPITQIITQNMNGPCSLIAICMFQDTRE